ncbi:reprolysin-like metallopeptidase [Arcticibacterium luteifluviistationis]|uniref:Peptidase M12B domain-containing protein n=1 Tax=Arcticibacterium luteifluviistationis TaxID=1784714 RepID=A0A2Z4GAX6_9BACT|nr:M12 family metallo-peptidase [Arcticibacterium luteifluviistationis]AWV98225.1 hypothetical protein DJ013_08595 [Arcticibacterium luteifluviistationis]
MNNSKRLVFGFCILISSQIHAQIPNLGVEIKLNLNSIKNTINDEKGSADFILNLPMPDGEFQVFNLKTSNIMDNQPSNIQTIEGVSLDGLAKIRLAITPSALTGIMQYENGYYLIEAIDQKEGRYTIYNMNDSGLGNCGTAEFDESKLVKRNGKVLSTGLFPIGTQLRKYRFAGAATGEMTDSLGTQTAARDKIVAIMNAANLIYELEAAVSFQVVEKTTNLNLIFTDGATDPFNVDTNFGSAYDSQDGFDILNGNSSLIYGDYDMGHTFHVYSSGGGGGSGGGSPCVNATKSVGWTEFGKTTSLGSIVGLFAHEVGHQFGMGHTYNATGGSDIGATFCTGGWSSSASVEPGSGTTIMGYGGNCSNNTNGSLQSYVLTSPNNESYFHAKSLDQMFTKMASVSNCFTNTATNNNTPIVSAGAAATIPKGTPFILTGSATDANTASNLLTYNWSQIDVAATNDAGALGSINGIGGYNAVNSTTAPLFRSRISSSPSRTFPDLSFILNNANNPSDNEGEDLPQVARIMNFRLTVRDNVLGGGGVDSDVRTITVDNSGPFQVSSQNGPTLWFQSESKTITWDVNGTNVAPVSCTNVNILISTDGGTSFSSLVANTANDGTETITVPNTPSANVRIKIEAVGNIFFDINNGSITISNGTCTPETSQLADASAVSAAVGSSNLNLNLLAVGSSIPGFSGSIETTDPTSNLSFEKAGACSGPSNSNRFDDYSFSVTTAGTFTFNLSGTGGNLLNLYSAAYNSSNVCTNWLASTGVYDNANNWVSLNSSMSKDLSPGTYYLVASSFSSTLPTLPAGYGVTVSGGTIYSQVPSSGSRYDYTFMIYNTGTSMVVGFSTTADLSLYNAGTYAVYGISYGGGLDLSPYIGQSLAAVQAAISNSKLCGKLSTNNKPVTIVGPCPPNLTHVSTTNDFSSGTQTFQTSNTTGTGLISATNDITGGNITYDAGKRVELKPGFSAISIPGNPAVFLAKIGGCE